MATYTFWNLDSVQQSRIPEGNVTQNFSTQQGNQSLARHALLEGMTEFDLGCGLPLNGPVVILVMSLSLELTQQH